MNPTSDLKKLEKLEGGPSRASLKMGVTYQCWYRWKTNQRQMSETAKILLRMLVAEGNGNIFEQYEKFKIAIADCDLTQTQYEKVIKSLSSFGV